MSILAKANAKKLITELCLREPKQVDLYAIAGCENLFIEERNLVGSEGQLVYDGSIGIISIDTKILEGGQKQFTIAHELGHYYNSGKKRGSFFCNGLDIRGISQSNGAETDANVFAAELLMPAEWFVKFVRGKRLETRLLGEVAQYFGVSLSAAALRYAEIGTHPVAVIMCKDGKIKWCRINKDFTFKFIRTESEVKELSYAYEFFKGERIPDQPDKILADAWFAEAYGYKPNYFLYEQNIPMYRYNAVLTLVWDN